jgi:type I restriction enzyme M protein
MRAAGGRPIRELNLIVTSRGKSPEADSYVDEKDGYALVIKAGSNISKYGQLITDEADWIEKNLYDEYVQKAAEANIKNPRENLNLVQNGDVLVSATGDGTLGKSCVFRELTPAIADGHVAVVRVDPTVVYPEYLTDYLRSGFGARQIERLYTGSTGLIELTDDALEQVVVDLLSDLGRQREASETLRNAEREYQRSLTLLEASLLNAVKEFAG